MVKKLLFGLVMLMPLSGCVSQIFLDGEPSSDVSNIAAGGVRKRIEVISSTTCTNEFSDAHYEIRENVGQRWVPRCARIHGFDYRPGNDYILQITEYASAPENSARLVLDKVIEERPHNQR